MSITEEVNSLKNDLLQVCEKIAQLQKQGIRIEFQIHNTELVKFTALQEMKLSS